MTVLFDAVLFDRDGTLVVDVPYNGDPDRVQPMPGAKEALDRLRAAGLRVGVVTNQSGLARGHFGDDQLAAVNRRIEELLGPFDTWQICPHDDTAGCYCRKPAPGMIEAAAEALGTTPGRCAMVGDIGRDMDAALAAGATGFLVPTDVTLPAEVAAAPHSAADLPAVAGLILRRCELLTPAPRPDRHRAPTVVPDGRHSAPTVVPDGQHSAPTVVPEERHSAPTVVPDGQHSAPTVVPEERHSAPTVVPDGQHSAPTVVPEEGHGAPTVVPDGQHCSPTVVPEERHGADTVVPQERAGTVLAVRSDSAGDVLVTGPAIRALAAGAERVVLLCGPRGRAAAELLPGIDEIIEWRLPWIDPEPGPVDAGDMRALTERLRATGASEAVVFTSFHQSALPLALLLRMAGVARITAISEDYPGSLLDVRHRVPDGLPEPERARSIAAAAGFALPAGDDGNLRLKNTIKAEKSGYVVVHPGASVEARACPPANLRRVVTALTEHGLKVLVTGGPGERDLAAYVAGSDGVDAGPTSMTGLAELIAGADCVIVGNTGPAHIAAAVGTPVISLYAPTVPYGRWGPYKVPAVRLGDPAAACRDTRATRCPVAGHPCLSSIEPSDVLDALRRLGVGTDFTEHPDTALNSRHADRKGQNPINETGEVAA